VLDKTGTVTTGTMTLLDAVPAPGTTREELLTVAGAVEDASEHPIAQAIAAGATSEVGELPAVDSFTSFEGRGVRGVAALSRGGERCVRSSRRRGRNAKEPCRHAAGRAPAFGWWSQRGSSRT